MTAVAPVVIETGGLWVGWPGVNQEDNPGPIPESSPDDKSPTAGLKTEQVCEQAAKTIRHLCARKRREVYGAWM